jgi:5-methylcytosine-specific restriction endonuclease McrA
MCRPTCEYPGCNASAQNVTGGDNPKFRRAKWLREEFGVENGWICATHHGKRIAKKHGAKNLTHVLAKNAGFTTATEYVNSKHPYLKYRKDYCENIDGRLGFTCTYTAPNKEQLEAMNNVELTFKGWLQVDHIDGNHTNNKEENLQTLCACCHTIKTAIYKDYSTPGRKSLKELV